MALTVASRVRVDSRVTATLLAGQDDLFLLGTEPIDGTGNGRANHIVGNGAGNALRGLGSDDTIEGGGGADVLGGDFGADLLDGGRGADRIFGGAGDDTLTGGFGSDLLVGGGGLDVFVFDRGTVAAGDVDVVRDFETGDIVSRNGFSTESLSFRLTPVGIEMTIALPEGGASKVLFEGVDSRAALRGVGAIVGGADDDTLFGGADDDRIFGGGGRDVIILGDGVDVATGGEDADLFVVTSPAPSLALADRVTDFEYGDRIGMRDALAGRSFGDITEILRLRALAANEAVLEIDADAGAGVAWRPVARFVAAPDWMTNPATQQALLLSQIVDVGRTGIAARAGDPLGFSNQNAVGCRFDEVELSPDGRYVAYRATYRFSGPDAGSFVPEELYDLAKDSFRASGRRLGDAEVAQIDPAEIADDPGDLLVEPTRFLRHQGAVYALESVSGAPISQIIETLDQAVDVDAQGNILVSIDYVQRDVNFSVKSGTRIIDLETVDLSSFDPPLNFTGFTLDDDPQERLSETAGAFFAQIGADRIERDLDRDLYDYAVRIDEDGGVFSLTATAGPGGFELSLDGIVEPTTNPFNVKITDDGRYVQVTEIRSSGNLFDISLIDLATESTKIGELIQPFQFEGLDVRLSENGDTALLFRSNRVTTQLEAVQLDDGVVGDYADARPFAFQLAPEPGASRVAITSGITPAGLNPDAPDSDWFLLPAAFAEAGVIVEVEGVAVAGQPKLADPVLRVHRGLGGPEAFEADGGVGRNEFARVGPYADAAGGAEPVYLEIAGAGEGGYRLTVRRLDEAERGRATPAVAAEDTTQLAALARGEQDWFRFKADAREARSFAIDVPDAADLEAFGLGGFEIDTLGSAVLSIHDARGRVRAIALDGDIDFVAPSAGDYFVSVRARLSDPTGAYVLEA